MEHPSNSVDGIPMQEPRPPRTEQAFSEYNLSASFFDPCPWCDAPFKPDPTWPSQQMRTHTEWCAFWLWVMADEEVDA